MLCAPGAATGASCDGQIPLPSELTPALAYLLSLNRPDLPEPPDLDSSRIEPVLNFVRSLKKEGVLYYADPSLGSPSAYHEIEIEGRLEQILRIVYNPGLTGGLCAPNSMRLSYWTRVNSGQPPLSRLWETQPRPDRPVVVRGMEREEITPDVFSGAYYGYDLNRTLMLFRHAGRKLMISLAKQKDRSTVGKKGLILGPDGDWNYAYTGEKGLDLFGLGWVSSYMYDSYSIIIYDEMKTVTPRVKFAVFKWVRAGWKGINVVRRNHILSGMKRHISAFKPIVEHPRVRSLKELESAVEGIRSMSTEVLRRQSADCLEALQRRLDREHKSDGKRLARLLAETPYLDRLTRREMVSLLSVEYLKVLLNMR